MGEHTLRLLIFIANLLSSPLMRSSYPSSLKSPELKVFLLFTLLFFSGLLVLSPGDNTPEDNGNGLTALIVLPPLVDELVLSVDTFLLCALDEIVVLRDAVVAGLIVFELSSEMLPVDTFGGDNDFRGDDFLGERGGKGGILEEKAVEEALDRSLGDRKVRPPSKSLSQSSSSVVDGVAWLDMYDARLDRR
jgi:hypothetical protein